MEEQGSIDGETEILIEEDVRGTGEDPDIGETERGLEEDIGEGDLIEVKRLLFTHISHTTLFLFYRTVNPIEQLWKAAASKYNKDKQRLAVSIIDNLVGRHLPCRKF